MMYSFFRLSPGSFEELLKHCDVLTHWTQILFVCQVSVSSTNVGKLSLVKFRCVRNHGYFMLNVRDLANTASESCVNVAPVPNNVRVIL